MPFNLLNADTLPLFAALLVICFLFSFFCAKSLRRACVSPRKTRIGWTILAGMSIGYGTWFAYFATVMSVDASVKLSLLTALLSLLVGIWIAIVGMAIAASTTRPAGRLAGGAFLGLSMLFTHQIGSLASATTAAIVPNPGYLFASAVEAFAMSLAGVWWITDRRKARLFTGSAILALEILLHHAIGLAAFGLPGG
jgi:NO-binding membrane sensor protein with MHYT domain